ncbi:MAG TPA: zinc-ribbon domain-containing protein, partial [Candidatus Limnocylindria bacterium]|nr:zinc-ribbon domain-containing protein [Candidatus Limnocylindria bacterium]
MKPCTACGRRNPPEHRFCEHCGAPLEPVPAAAAPAPAGPEAATLAPGEASPLHRLPTWLAVGIVVGALIAFGIVGTVLAGQFGSAPGGNGSPIPSGSGAVRTVTTTHVSLEAPVEWEAQA